VRDHYRRNRRFGGRDDNGQRRGYRPAARGPRHPPGPGSAGGPGQRRDPGCVQWRAGGLRPGAPDHHHLRHLEHFLVHRIPGVRLLHGERHPEHPGRIRPRRCRHHPGRAALVLDHHPGGDRRLVVPALHQGRPQPVRHRWYPGGRPAGRDLGAAPTHLGVCDHRVGRGPGRVHHDRHRHLHAGPVGGPGPGAGGHRRRGDRRYLDHGRPRLRGGHLAGRAAGAVGTQRRDAAGLALPAGLPVRGHLHHHRRRHRPAAGTRKEAVMTSTTTSTPRTGPVAAVRNWVDRGGLRERRVLLLGLIIVLLIVMKILGAAGLTNGNFNSDYLAGSLINFVPMALLALAELFVILSGRGSIDRSVGSIVSVVGMGFGVLFAGVGLPLAVSSIAAVLLGSLLGAFNGLLIAYFGYPALITPLSSKYAARATALLVTGT